VAQKVTVSLVDDLSGSQADETVSFGLDGKNYEIDLSSKNADKLRGALVDYVGAARKAGGTHGGAAASPAPRPAVDREQNQGSQRYPGNTSRCHRLRSPTVRASAPRSWHARRPSRAADRTTRATVRHRSGVVPRRTRSHWGTPPRARRARRSAVTRPVHSPAQRTGPRPAAGRPQPGTAEPVSGPDLGS
jgi:Lsr2